MHFAWKRSRERMAALTRKKRIVQSGYDIRITSYEPGAAAKLVGPKQWRRGTEMVLNFVRVGK